MGHSAVHLGPVTFKVPTVPCYTRASPEYMFVVLT